MPVLKSKQVVVVVSSIILVLLSFVACGLRCYSIPLMHRKIAVHDVLCFVSLVMLVGYTIDMLLATISGGIGIHIGEVTPSQMIMTRKAFFASQFMWAISIASFRLAMLDFYTRTFATYKFCLVARGLMVIVILFFIGSITTTLRMCVPISYNWDSSIDGACGDLAAGELAAAAFNLVLDVVIVLLPCRIIWGLQMSVRKKAAVSATFGLSLIISGINLARIIEVLVCDLADFTYCTANAMILTVAEPAVGIIVVCVPTLGPIIFPERRERFVKAYRPSHYGSHNTHMDLTDADRWRRVSWTSSRNGLVRDQMQGEIPRTDRSGDLHEVSVPTGVEGGLQDHYEMTDRVKGIQWDPV